MSGKQQLSVTIITVCLNDCSGLKKTAESIASQTCTDFEWIVVDGGSTDGTPEVLNRFSARINQLISEPDKGIFDAMNKGIVLAKGEYCLFLNAGDVLFDLDVLANTRNNLVTDLVVGGIQRFYPESHKVRLVHFDTQDIRKKYLYSKTLPHQATFIRRSLFKQYGMYDNEFQILGDYDFFVRVLTNGASLGFSSFCIASYRMDGISSRLKGKDLFLQELRRLRKNNFSLFYRIWREIVDFVEPLVFRIERRAY